MGIHKISSGAVQSRLLYDPARSALEGDNARWELLGTRQRGTWAATRYPARHTYQLGHATHDGTRPGSLMAAAFRCAPARPPKP